MRLNKFFLVTLLALSTTLLQSCLKDQEDIFEESPSERMQATLDDAKKTLMSSENGWAFDYYPSRELYYGGFVYTAKFDEKNVTIGCELAPGEFESSLYKLTNDNGPILSFDSYNTMMHFFATPSSSAYQAYDGDFEFMIMDITDDLITLRGKRTGNTMYLRKLTLPADQYITDVVNMSDNIFVTEADGTVGSGAINAKLLLGERYMEIAWGDGEEQQAGEYFVPIPSGIRFLNPLEINGSKIETLDFDTQRYIFTGTTSDGNQVSLTGKLGEDYCFVSEFAGEFEFSYTNQSGLAKSLKCTLSTDESGNLIIEGLNANYDLILSYNKSYGCIELRSQKIGVYNGFDVFMYAGTSSSFYANLTTGYYFRKNMESPSRFEMTPNGVSQSANCNLSFVMVYNNGSSYYVAPSSLRINGDYMFQKITFIKK